MKKHTSVLLMALALTAPTAGFAAIQEVVQIPENVFIPDGFDSNDHTEMVLYGHFPNTCFHAGAATATFSDGKILVKNSAYMETEGNCIKMIVPWMTTVSAGVLPAGNFPVVFQKSGTELMNFGNFPVATSISQSIDDHLYAYVNSAMIRNDSTGTPSVTLSGSFGISCMYIKEVRLERNKADVVTVLPIVDLDQTKPCAVMFAPIPFESTFKLDSPLKTPATLFHIRSMNGQSVNRVVE